MILQGRIIRAGLATGPALVSTEPVSFYGGVDLETGVIVEKGHPLAGEALGGKVLVIPRGKGSTVGSWAILRLQRRGLGPVAIVCRQCETIVAVGVILAEIPCVDQVDVTRIRSGQQVCVDGAEVRVEDTPVGDAAVEDAPVEPAR